MKYIFPVLLMLFTFSLGLSHNVAAQVESDARQKVAYFAGGCFWCVEEAFEKLDGVEEVISGYSGGDVKNPAYEQVASGETYHYEAVKVVYNPDEVSYITLLATFWKNIDPHDSGGQFCDRGEQYKAAIFVKDDRQEELATKSKAALEKEDVLNDPVLTEIVKFKAFYPAEDYHQDYYRKNSVRYGYYKYFCGRESRLKEIWAGTDVRGLFEKYL